MLVYREFTKNLLPDQIAFNFIYILILRTELHTFIAEWNTHRIRKQRKRPNSIFNIPWILYHHPKTSIRNEGLNLPQELHTRLQKDVKDYDKSMIAIFVL